MRQLSRRLLPLVAILVLPACFSMQHTVGVGPRAPDPVVIEESQWFALYGLIPLGSTDGGRLATGAKDYRITTRFTLTDVVLTAFTSFFTFYRQTVIVEQ